jgi:NADH-quinone oxidoreductase subunit J
MEQLLFVILSIITLSAAVSVIIAKNPVYSILSLVVTFFSIAGHYILLQSQFLAIVNIIVYAGAIMVLFLFVIMLLNLNKDEHMEQRSFFAKLAIVVAACLFLVTSIGYLKGNVLSPIDTGLTGEEIGTVQKLGQVLFSEYVLPFEISSLLFLSAMIGAVMLGKKDLKDH